MLKAGHDSFSMILSVQRGRVGNKRKKDTNATFAGKSITNSNRDCTYSVGWKWREIENGYHVIIFFTVFIVAVVINLNKN